MSTDAVLYEVVERNGRKLDRILKLLEFLATLEKQMAADLTAIQTAVTNNGTVEGSAITLLQQLSAQIAALQNDPAALQALADSLNSQAAQLAAAVTANTPVTPQMAKQKKP